MRVTSLRTNISRLSSIFIMATLRMRKMRGRFRFNAARGSFQEKDLWIPRGRRKPNHMAGTETWRLEWGTRQMHNDGAYNGKQKRGGREVPGPRMGGRWASLLAHEEIGAGVFLAGRSQGFRFAYVKFEVSWWSFHADDFDRYMSLRTGRVGHKTAMRCVSMTQFYALMRFEMGHKAAPQGIGATDSCNISYSPTKKVSSTMPLNQNHWEGELHTHLTTYYSIWSHFI